MTVELLQNLSLAAYLAAGVFLGIAVLLFFVFHVPQLIGDLSGATARRAIESIERQSSSETGRKGRRNRSGREMFSTERFRTGRLEQKSADETTVLTSDGASETTLLTPDGASETTVLASDGASQKISVDVEFGFSESVETID